MKSLSRKKTVVVNFDYLLLPPPFPSIATSFRLERGSEVEGEGRFVLTSFRFRVVSELKFLLSKYRYGVLISYGLEATF